jgi:BMFP domain-containing protein YqiC
VDQETAMTQTTNRIFDELGKLMTDAAGAAQGARREVEGVLRGQAERILADLDLVKREDFEAVKTMAVKAREENEILRARVEALEARITALEVPGSGHPGIGSSPIIV